MPVLASALIRAAQLLPTGLPLPIVRGPLRGGRWMVGAAPGPTKGLSVLGNLSEPTQLAEADRLSRGADVCFDIGAHSGLYSLVFARHARRVFAFEPLPRNVRFLHRTLELNGVTNVVVVPFAVAGATGLLGFQAGEHTTEGRIDDGGALPVFGVTLADFMARYGVAPDLLKIDVEGAELDVLRGGVEYLRERKPSLLLSMHGAEARLACLAFLRELGYGSIRPLDTRTADEATEFAVEA